MIVILHVLIALASIVFVTAVYSKPTIKKLYTSYGLVVLTVLSGVYMTVSSPALMLRSCVAGIAYISVVSLVIVAMRAKVLRPTITTE